MIDVRHWKWKMDVSERICFNKENQVVVKIEKVGEKAKGKIVDLSMDLFWKIAEHKNGPIIVQQIQYAAENEYRRTG